jgi:threonine aldolase
VWNGTGANVVALSAICRAWESVICAETAHINTDECAAPEHIANVKLVPVATPDGKLTPQLVAPHLTGFGFEHHAQPRVISISQASEFGTVYTPPELRALADIAHEHGVLLHVDGARLANAAVGLGCSLAEITHAAGVDALSFGGTKNGMLAGEAVVLFGEAATTNLPYIRKQSAQLASKMRFVAAQFVAMYEGDLWRQCAGNANAMAARLAEGAAERGVRIAQPVGANEVFAELPDERVPELRERFHFYDWQPGQSAGTTLVRWVTSWDTTPEDVEALLAAL